jgi:hypothetical protein
MAAVSLGSTRESEREVLVTETVASGSDDVSKKLSSNSAQEEEEGVPECAHKRAMKESTGVQSGTEAESPRKNAASSSSWRESTELTSESEAHRRTLKGRSSGGGVGGGVSLGDEMSLVPSVSKDSSVNETQVRLIMHSRSALVTYRSRRVLESPRSRRTAL